MAVLFGGNGGLSPTSGEKNATSSPENDAQVTGPSGEITALDPNAPCALKYPLASRPPWLGAQAVNVKRASAKAPSPTARPASQPPLGPSSWADAVPVKTTATNATIAATSAAPRL